jgi:hypothetical protein
MGIGCPGFVDPVKIKLTLVVVAMLHCDHLPSRPIPGAPIWTPREHNVNSRAGMARSGILGLPALLDLAQSFGRLRLSPALKLGHSLRLLLLGQELVLAAQGRKVRNRDAL